MDIEKIEDDYKQELENAKEDFMQSEKLAKNAKKREAIYKKKLKAARDKYYVSVAAYLKRERAKKHSMRKKAKQAKNEQFRAKTADMQQTFSERLKVRLHLFFFKLKLKLKGPATAHLRNSLSYHKAKIKIKFKQMQKALGRTNDRFKAHMQVVSEHIQESAKKTFTYLKDKTSKVMKFLKEKIKILTDKLKKKPSQKSEDKKEESKSS